MICLIRACNALGEDSWLDGHGYEPSGQINKATLLAKHNI